MKIDVEQSIRGLWIASGQEGYLDVWFPRLRTNKARLIPLAPGINVFYGRNGAGKTQILEAIAYAANFRMSSYEGFILHNPRISGVRSDIYAQDFVFDISPEELFARYAANRTEDMWIGWHTFFDPSTINSANRKLILGILQEFIAGKSSLLTRSPSEDSPAVGDASEMNPPQFMQIVPLLLPTDFAPITRAHAKEIYESYLKIAEHARSLDPGSDSNLTAQENDATYIAYLESSRELLEDWLGKWSWSPLINARNFDSVWIYGPTDTDETSPLWDSENMPIYLPAIVSYDTKPEYREFPYSFDQTVSLSLTRETFVPASMSNYDSNRADDELVEINWSNIGYQNVGPESKEINQPEIYKNLMADYLTRLRAKLKFLPNFRNLDQADSSFDEHPHLVNSQGISALRGSAAERRWLKLARETMSNVTQWVVIDEPEAGLHRTAEAELAYTLSSPSWNSGSVVVVATHSPEFLDIPNAHVLHIDDGRVRELTNVDREDLISLGLRPGDLLTQIRTFLLVEGEHERIIFENLFQEELRRAGCKIIVARGAKNMKDVFESQMIFNFSDAVIISLLDNINSAEVNVIWQEAKKLADTGKLIEAGQYVRTSLPRDKSGENVFLSQFLTLALANGEYERVEVWGLSKPDIVHYFDPRNFGVSQSWEELITAHTTSDPSFKIWASKKFGANFDLQTIDRASRSVDVIPGEFGDLMMRIAELSRRV